MRLIIKRCQICSQFHNHLSCPYCGAVKIGKTHIDMANGRELVRSFTLPRVLAEQIERQVTRNELTRIVPRLASR